LKHEVYSIYEMTHIMDHLIKDCLNYILEFLDDISYLRFISTCKKYYYGFHQKKLSHIYDVSDIQHVFDRYYFTRIVYTFSNFEITRLSRVEMLNFSFYDGDFRPIMDILAQFKYLTSLTIPYKYGNLITQFPARLLELNLGNLYNHPLENLPTCLTKLVLNSNFNRNIHWPPCLRSFSFNYQYINSNNTKMVNLIQGLPDTLHTLELPNNLNHEIRRYPRELRILVFGNMYNSYINAEYLPPNLRILDLKLSTFYQYTLNNIGLLQNLRILQLPFINYNQPINPLPKNLVWLSLSNNYNYPLELPETLLFLSIGQSFEQKLRLPKDLMILIINSFKKLEVEFWPQKILYYYGPEQINDLRIPKTNSTYNDIRYIKFIARLFNTIYEACVYCRTYQEILASIYNILDYDVYGKRYSN